MMISVWIDRISEPGKATVIVSCDTDWSSDTLRTYRVSRQMTAARVFARAEAKRRHVEAVIESPDGSGFWAAL